MATLRSDLIIPEIFTPYVIEQTTQLDAFWHPELFSQWPS